MADVTDTLAVLVAALMQKPSIRAVMDDAFRDVILYGHVRPETESRIAEEIKMATGKTDG